MITAEMKKKLAKMTTTEQTEWISVFCGKHKLKYGEFVEKYGAMIPPPKKTQHKEIDWWEGTGRKSFERAEKEYTCQVCGKTFLSSSPRAQRCEECRYVLQLERARAWKAKNPRPKREKVCNNCGRRFIAQKGQEQYCSAECKKEAMKRSHQAYQKRAKERENAKIQEQKNNS